MHPGIVQNLSFLPSPRGAQLIDALVHNAELVSNNLKSMRDGLEGTDEDAQAWPWDPERLHKASSA